MRLPRNNTPAEIKAFDTLCQRLSGFADHLSAEYVDGYLTALAAGPSAPPLADWLPKLTGDAFDRAFGDPEDRAQAEKALANRLTVLCDQLDAEALLDDQQSVRLAPLMVEWTEEDRAAAVKDGAIEAEHAGELVTGAEWADGFFAGLNDHHDGWVAEADEEQGAVFESLLAQVHALRLAEGSEELAAHIAEVYGPREGEKAPADTPAPDRDRLIDEACFAVQDLRLWWVDNAPKPETRRVAPQPGRNDPCHCGSGKKFKKCHGAAA
jgi:uncharacterized protein